MIEKGILFEKFDTQVVSDKFRKREFVIIQKKEGGTYSWDEHLKFQLTQDNCSKLDALDIGDIITVDFNLKGRRVEKNGEVYYFNSLDAWNMTGEQNEQAIIADKVVDPPVTDELDDLPF